MNPAVAIMGAGAMGSAVARRLADHGVKVTTALEGRSAESVARARAASMTDVPLAKIADSEIILSIVPPGVAYAVAQSLSTFLTAAERKPIYVDCNAVNPETTERIAAIVSATGCAFVDAGIIGGPPRPGARGATFYLSGDAAGRVAELTRFGIAMHVLGGPVGAASALKMSYAGITKGLTALASVMILAATRAGMAEALKRELAESQPALLAWFERQVPSMFPKAYRWVAEMEEIAGFVARDPAAHDIFGGAADFYERIAADVAGARTEAEDLAAFFK